MILENLKYLKKEETLSITNEIVLRRRGSLYLSKEHLERPENDKSKELIPLFLRALEEYGFYMDLSKEETLKYLNRLSLNDIRTILNLMNTIFKENIENRTLYYNFPEGVENLSGIDFYVDALLYELTRFNYKPKEKEEFKRKQEEYLSEKELKELEVVGEEELKDIFRNLLTSKKALSNPDKMDLINILMYSEAVKPIITSEEETIKEIKFKETMVLTYVHTREYGYGVSLLGEYLVKSPTDILRFLQYLAERCTDLRPRFRLPMNIKDEEISLEIVDLLSRLEDKDLNYVGAEMLKYKEEWKFIFRHLNKKVKRNNKYIELLEKVLYKEKKIENFYRNEHNAYMELLSSQEVNSDVIRDFIKVYEKNHKLNGEFLRKVLKLAKLPLTEEAVEEIGNAIIEAIQKAETRVTYQLYNSIVNRENARGVFIQGKFYKLENVEESEMLTNKHLKTFILRGLYRRFKNEEQEKPLKVEYNSILSNIKVNTSNRDSSKNYQGLEAGTKIQLKRQYDYLRFFCKWEMLDRKTGQSLSHEERESLYTEEELRYHEYIDIDLSAYGISEDSVIFTSSFYSMSNDGVYHSGDVRKSPGEEYIDVDIERMKELGVKQILISTVDYDKIITDKEIPSVLAGVQVLKKEDRNKGKIFKPSEVLFNSEQDLDNRAAMVLVYNVEENSILWVDRPINTDRVLDIRNREGKGFINVKTIITQYENNTLTVDNVLRIKEKAGLIEFVDEEDKSEEKIVLAKKKEDGTYMVKSDLISKVLE